MLRILAATDFSDNAYHALLTAVKLAARYAADVTFLHVMQAPTLPANSPEEVYHAVFQEQRGEMQLKLHDESLRVYQQLQLRPIEAVYQFRILTGPVPEAILQLIQQESIDLLVMGTSSHSGLKRFLLGSNTAEMVNRTPVPLLIIPDNYSLDDFRDITLVIRHNRFGYRHGFDLMARFGRTSGATFHLFVIVEDEHASTGKPTLASMLDSEELLEKYQDIPHTITTIADNNKTSNLKKHIKATHTDLLVWLPARSGIWSNSLSEAFTEEVANKAGIPLLLIPTQQT